MKKAMMVLALAALARCVAVAADEPKAGWMAELPRPVFDEKPELVDLYYKAWEIAHTRIDYLPGIPVPRYMDEGHRSDWIWIWDTCFMVHYCKYGAFEFPGVESLGNFYGILMPDGKMELPKVKGNRWSCGPKGLSEPWEGRMLDFKVHLPEDPPLFAWTEYRHALQTGDRARLERIYTEKRYLQRWFETFENFDPSKPAMFGATMPVKCKREGDLGYHWTGGSSGMDNTPRGRKGDKDLGPNSPADCPDNPDLLWVDAIAQQGLAALYIARIAELLGKPEEAAEWMKKYEAKRDTVNNRYFCWPDRFYYDIDMKGRFVKVPSIASYWPMLAEMPDPGHLKGLLQKLTDPEWFGGAVPTPSLARKDADFWPTGGYWRGAVWLPTTYMTLKALDAYGENELARDIGRRLVFHMQRTYAEFEPHTIWECYSPTEPKPSTYAKSDCYVRDNFCGWSALGPISVFLEDVIGIKQANAFENTLVCDFAKEIVGRAGVEQYRFGNVRCDIIATTGKITVRSNLPFTLKANGRTYQVQPGENSFDRDRREQVNVSDFDTIQAALDSGARTIVFDRAHSPFVAPDTLRVRSDSELVFEDGAVLEAQRGGFRTLRSELLSLSGVSNVVIRGRGARGVIRMHREDYDAKKGKGPNAQGYSWSEWRHAVGVDDSRNVLLENLWIEKSGGDGICTGDSDGLVLRDVVCDSNYRQGLSICGARNFLAENCVFANTKGTPPQSGVDVEPWLATQPLENVVFRNCISTNNAACGFEIYLRDITDAAPPVSVLFDGCRTVGNHQGFFVNGGFNRTNHCVKGEVRFRKCVAETPMNMGFFIGNSPADAWRPVIEDCTVDRARGVWTQSDVTFWHENASEAPISGVTIRNLRILQARDQNWIVYGGNGKLGGRCPSDVTGNVFVTDIHGQTREIKLDEAWCRTLRARGSKE